VLVATEHFAVSPDWKWYILFYFFLGGVAGGSYVVATLMRLVGDERGRVAARTGFIVAFLAVLICPVLLILDLGTPSRFWHMLINTTPGHEGLILKSASPMSLGAWGLLLFAIFALVSFVEALASGGARLPGGSALVRMMSGPLGTGFMVVGSVLGLFVASYTGVLLAVSNQPVWSDSWTLGGLFLASGMSAAVVVLSAASRFRAGSEPVEGRLAEADGYFAAIEVLFIVVFWVTLASAHRLGTVFDDGWVVLWIVVLVSLLPALAGLVTRAARALRTSWPPVAALMILGVLALRAVVIFSPQS
jgi:formate-dependent nitrite reductase membrane component NrfD